MWACSEHLRWPPLRFTTSQTQGAHPCKIFHALFCVEKIRTSPVSKHGPWSRLRNAWRLEARLPTTFPNLRTTRHPVLFRYEPILGPSFNQSLTIPFCTTDRNHASGSNAKRCRTRNSMRGGVDYDTQGYNICEIVWTIT